MSNSVSPARNDPYTATLQSTINELEQLNAQLKKSKSPNSEVQDLQTEIEQLRKIYAKLSQSNHDINHSNFNQINSIPMEFIKA